MGNRQSYRMIDGQFVQYTSREELLIKIDALQRQLSDKDAAIERLKVQVEDSERKLKNDADKNIQVLTAFLGKLSSDLSKLQSGIFNELANLNRNTADRQSARVAEVLEILGIQSKSLGIGANER